MDHLMELALTSAARPDLPPPDVRSTHVSQNQDSEQPSSTVSPASQASVTTPDASNKRRCMDEPPSSDGCVVCRARKIRCTGRPQERGKPCQRCEKHGHACDFVGAQAEKLEKVSQSPGSISLYNKVSRVKPSERLTEAGTLRKRAQRACKECHKHKTKCKRTEGQSKCDRCIANYLHCAVNPSKRNFTAAAPVFHDDGENADEPRGEAMKSPVAPTSPSAGAVVDTLQDPPLSPPPPPPPRLHDPRSSSVPVISSAGLDSKQLVSPSNSGQSSALTNLTRQRPSAYLRLPRDLSAEVPWLKDHFHMWFKVWAGMPMMGFLHPKTTAVEIEEKRLNPIIGKMVCAVVSRYLRPQARNLSSFATACSNDAHHYIVNELDLFDNGNARENLIILCVGICHHWSEQNRNKVSVYSALAIRLIKNTHLNWDGSGRTAFEEESIRRLVWMVWMVDHYLADGYDDQVVLRDEAMHIQQPVDDGETSHHLPGVEPFNGSLARFLILLYARKYRMLGLIKKFMGLPAPYATGRGLQMEAAISAYRTSRTQLLSFGQTFPPLLKMTPNSIQYWSNTPSFSNYIMLHTGFLELSIELHTICIPGVPWETSPEFFERVKQHGDFMASSQKEAIVLAVRLSRFWRDVHRILMQREWYDGTERLFTSDPTLPRTFKNVAKILLAARKYPHLYLGEGGNASPALEGGDPITDQMLAALIESNLELFRPVAYFYPDVDLLAQELRNEIAEIETQRASQAQTQSETVTAGAAQDQGEARQDNQSPNATVSAENIFTHDVSTTPRPDISQWLAGAESHQQGNPDEASPYRDVDAAAEDDSHGTNTNHWSNTMNSSSSSPPAGLPPPYLPYPNPHPRYLVYYRASDVRETVAMPPMLRDWPPLHRDDEDQLTAPFYHRANGGRLPMPGIQALMARPIGSPYSRPGSPGSPGS